MTKTRMLGLMVAATVIATASAALAHHSFAMFDASKEVILNGTVSQFRWSNPHCFIKLTVMEKGQPVEYSIEAPSPNQLSGAGWSAASLKPGERARITIQPLRDGSKGGSFVRAALADGRTLALAN